MINWVAEWCSNNPLLAITILFLILAVISEHLESKVMDKETQSKVTDEKTWK